MATQVANAGMIPPTRAPARKRARTPGPVEMSPLVLPDRTLDDLPKPEPGALDSSDGEDDYDEAPSSDEEAESVPEPPIDTMRGDRRVVVYDYATENGLHRLAHVTAADEMEVTNPSRDISLGALFGPWCGDWGVNNSGFDLVLYGRCVVRSTETMYAASQLSRHFRFPIHLHVRGLLWDGDAIHAAISMVCATEKIASVTMTLHGQLTAADVWAAICALGGATHVRSVSLWTRVIDKRNLIALFGRDGLVRRLTEIAGRKDVFKIDGKYATEEFGIIAEK